MVDALFAPKLLILYAWAACAAYVHLRGRVRLRLGRQILNYSSFIAPFSVFVYLFSPQPRARFFDVDDFPQLAPLRAEWKAIRDEAVALLEDEHIRPAERMDDIAFNSFFRRGWKRFHLKWYDEVLPSARRRCPRTVELVESIPSVNAALFALLPPGGRLGKHRDPFAGSLRYHLGLITPNSDECRIYVDGERYSWRDGEAVLFDETFIHWARNDSDQARVILFCDVERPLRTRFARAVNRFVTRRLVRVTSSNNLASERIGLVNRGAARLHRVQQWARQLKRRHRGLYSACKVVLVTLAAAALVYACAR